MAANSKIDSNSVGFAIAAEESVKTLPTTPVWIPIDVNSFGNFGAEYTSVARRPISADRQRQRGGITDLDAGGSFQLDLCQRNHQELLQGFFFAAMRNKAQAKNDIGISTMTIAVDAATDKFTVGGSGGPASLSAIMAVGDIVLTAGFTDPANNGLFKIATIDTAFITVTAADGADTAVTLVDEAANSAGSIVRVGVETAVGDIDVDMTGSRPALTSTTLDFDDLGVIPGEFIYLGGDATAVKFTNSVNNGFARVRSVDTNRIEFDKTQSTWVTETNTTKLVQIFLGRVLKNETGTSIVRTTYQGERQLGKPDSTDTYNQCEYLTGCVPNEFTLTIPTADKVTSELSFVAMGHEVTDSDTGPKTGTRPSLTDESFFNTSSHFSRIKMAVFSETDANPSSLFAFATDISFSVNNNVSANKAIGVLGAFDATVGVFEVSGDITAYFADVAAVEAIIANSEVTVDACLVKENAGIVVDLPLVSLGNGRLNVVQDEAITLPLAANAVSGAAIDTDLDHTMLMVFFDYLPDLAEA